MTKMTLDQARSELTHEYRKHQVLYEIFPHYTSYVKLTQIIHHDRLNIGEENEILVMRSHIRVLILSRIYDLFRLSVIYGSNLRVGVIYHQDLFLKSDLAILLKHLYMSDHVSIVIKHHSDGSVSYKARDVYNEFPDLDLLFFSGVDGNGINSIRGQQFDVLFSAAKISPSLVRECTQTPVFLKDPTELSVEFNYNVLNPVRTITPNFILDGVV